MAESKRSPSRLSSLRDSVKKFTERLSDGDSDPVSKNDEHIRELEKLRIQIQSMEEELRQLHQSRYQLEQVYKQNEKLTSTLQDAKAQIEALRAEVDKLTAPPSTYAIFSSLNTDATAYGGTGLGNRDRLRVTSHPWDGQPASAELSLPPLGVLWLVPQRQLH